MKSKLIPTIIFIFVLCSNDMFNLWYLQWQNLGWHMGACQWVPTFFARVYKSQPAFTMTVYWPWIPGLVKHSSILSVLLLFFCLLFFIKVCAQCIYCFSMFFFFLSIILNTFYICQELHNSPMDRTCYSHAFHYNGIPKDITCIINIKI